MNPSHNGHLLPLALVLLVGCGADAGVGGTDSDASDVSSDPDVDLDGSGADIGGDDASDAAEDPGTDAVSDAADPDTGTDTTDAADTADASADTTDGGDPDATDAADTSDTTDADVPDVPGLPIFQICESAPLPDGLPTEDWQHSILTPIVTATGSAWHSANDVITTPERDAFIVGKFTYGAISKDLEDEIIEVWMDDCSGAYVRLGEQATDTDGRIALRIAADDLPLIGRYAIYQRVVGDNSFTRSTLRVLPVGTRIIVTDIDATLTTDDLELFTDVFTELFEPLLGGYDPTARDGATELTQLRYEQGYVLLYMTGRPYSLTDITREWLADHDMAPGAVRLTDSNSDVLPTEGAVGTYKTDVLLNLRDMGLIIDGAYGNASTDIYAYANADVPLERTWIAGANGGDGGTQAVGEGYTDHLVDAAAEGPADQPFIRE